MDPDICGWILEFLLTQTCIDDQILNDLINVLPIPSDNTNLKKSLLLRRIESDISKGTVSVLVLELLEIIQDLDQKQGIIVVPESMKTAYCAVAIHCSLRLLEADDIFDKEQYSDVVKTIWKDRAVKMMTFFEVTDSGINGLVSEELKSWMCNIKDGVWDPLSFCKNVSVMKYVKSKDVVEVLRVYVTDAKEKIGRSFLELVAEKLVSDDHVMKQVMGVGKEIERGREVGANSSLIDSLLKRRTKRSWSAKEENVLWSSVKKYGKGKWKMILSMYPDVFVERSAVDLKDKWRNMSRYES